MPSSSAYIVSAQGRVVLYKKRTPSFANRYSYLCLPAAAWLPDGRASL